MDLSRSRAMLALLPTPLVRASRLERALGAGPIFFKRDDLTGFGLAGNKARALEYLVGAALAEGCDVFVATGSPSSNFCAAAAMAARVAGLDCDLLFPGQRPSISSVNVQLARAAGARLIFGAAETREQLDAAVAEHADSLGAHGRRPYVVPRGGATAVGAIGFVRAAQELSEQCEDADLAPRTIVMATGSGGSQAGLVAGRAELGTSWQVVGAGVSRPAPDVAGQVLRLSRECAASLCLAAPAAEDVDVRDCRGAGFGIASDQDRISSQLALEHEGLLLDDFYGAKAMTLLRNLLAEDPEGPIVFWHTGGVAAALTSLVGRAS